MGALNYPNGSTHRLPITLVREGPIWIATASLGGAEIMIRVDERIIIGKLKALYDANPAITSGFFDDLVKGARSVARSSALRGALNAVSKVVKHPAFGAARAFVPGLGMVADSTVSAIQASNSLLNAAASKNPMQAMQAVRAIAAIKGRAAQGDPKSSKMLAVLNVVDKTPALPALISQAQSDATNTAQVATSGASRFRPRGIKTPAAHATAARTIRAILKQDYRARNTITKSAGEWFGGMRVSGLTNPETGAPYDIAPRAATSTCGVGCVPVVSGNTIIGWARPPVIN